MLRDVGLAEDLAQDALVIALERWPESGVPDNPGAWLMATAKRRAIDRLRRGRMLERKHQELGRESAAGEGGCAARRGPRRSRGRRPPAPRADLVPPGALDRGPCRADAAPGRRPHDARDRAGVPGPRVDARPAHREGEADPRERARALRGAAGSGPHRAPVGGARGDLPRLQRRLLGDRRDDWLRPALCEVALRLGHVLAELARASRRSTASSR